MDTKKIIGIIGISHTYPSIIKALKNYNYDIVICDINYEKMINENYPKYSNYKDLENKIDIAFVSTPPKFHYEIALYFLKRGIKVICEKPLVTNIKYLNILSGYKNLYNILHFSYGNEIFWFMKNFNTEKLPFKIVCIINDPYVNNKKIINSKISLHGSYLDEAINPLSAIKRIYKKELKFVSISKKIYKNDIYDYSSNSVFKMCNTLIYVNTFWNDKNNKDKYIDLYYENTIIRLDSINVKVIDLINNKELYKSCDNRMDSHYKNGLKKIYNNKEEFYNLNKVILEGEQYAKDNFY